ncbi:MAG TPA: glycosyltransferase family 1 protein [Nitrospiraceae bacterium]|nr:glycosyltransferase family 1 protein [Nitrospiraceae bacterium]
MIRVGFILTFNATGWLGGISYFRNLLGALVSLPQPRIAPVILAGTQSDAGPLAQFPALPLIRSSLLDAESPAWVVRRFIAKLLGRDIGLERIIRRHNVQVLSHQGFLGGLGKIPILGWIPDFQEHHLPEFFSRAEILARARKRSLVCRTCSCVILSSFEAQRDLNELDKCCAKKAKVLRFVANAPAPRKEDVVKVVQRLGVDRPYFYLPNQFWKHKNHRVVVNALCILKDRGISACVIASGNVTDHRQPGYFNELMSQVREAGVENRFVPVGTVPYSDLLALMAGAIAVINPSLFEGWSTTVEEAKSMGKLVLLSDIGVHREQAPGHGRYFSPDDAEGLAKLMEEAQSGHDDAVDQQMIQAAQEALPDRLRVFAREYEDIVLEQAV